MAEGIEGWVIYNKTGRFKLKTKWYMDRHRLIDVRERDIARFVLEETLDDLIPNLMEGDADMTKVREIEHTIVSDLAMIYYDVQTLAERAMIWKEGRERAEWINSNAGELASFVHRAARGLENSDENVRKWYIGKYLSKFSLRSIGNPNFRKVDDDE